MSASRSITEEAPQPIVVFWFRRDLRLEDNAGLFAALSSGLPVLPLFIFDTNILSRLEDRDDARVAFIHRTVCSLNESLRERGSALLAEKGPADEVISRLVGDTKKAGRRFTISALYTNGDYEPYAINRDDTVARLLKDRGIEFHAFKDQVIFEKQEVAKDNDGPYTVYSAYARKWRALLTDTCLKPYPSDTRQGAFLKWDGGPVPRLEELGFQPTAIEIPSSRVDVNVLKRYAEDRDIPSLQGTSRLGIHLRFGTISVREMVKMARRHSDTWLNELIWREFFMQILWNFPHVVGAPFRPEYAKISWREDEDEYRAWTEGRTGYPIVDAGMRELNATGFMHNRVRMIAASFLVKHLLIDWREGEAYFARRLLDFELASNNGNWQWVAGSGCDAAPYFRVFNPELQTKRFDPKGLYIKRWVPEVGTPEYPEPIIDHVTARSRVLRAYGAVLGRKAPKPSRSPASLK